MSGFEVLCWLLVGIIVVPIALKVLFWLAVATFGLLMAFVSSNNEKDQTTNQKQ